VRARPIVAVLVLFAALPTAAGANHLHSGYPDCRGKAAVRSGAFPTGDVSIVGFGGVLDSAHGGRDGAAFALPEIANVTPRPVYGPDFHGESVLYEGDVGGGTAALRPLQGIPGDTRSVFSGAMKLTLQGFTGHFKIEKKVIFCESLVKANTIYKNDLFKFTLNGLRTPVAAGSPQRGWGEAANIEVAPGDAANH
jgi:hypothetical protein